VPLIFARCVMSMTSNEDVTQEVQFPAGDAKLTGDLIVPAGASGIVLFAHGSGSSRHSPRNKGVAAVLRASGLGTFLFDLLTADEESIDIHTRHLRFDIQLLADRLVHATRWVEKYLAPEQTNIGYFGASTGGGAALVAAAELGDQIAAVVSRGGRPDLAGDALSHVKAATLLIVGELDPQVIDLNRQAFDRIEAEKKLEIVPRATHLFEEPGTLEIVFTLATNWFTEHCIGKARAQPG
jgi:putative phosphoribosyl transferase